MQFSQIHVLNYIKQGDKYMQKIGFIGCGTMRRTLEGTKIKRQHVSGFRARMATPGGREVLNRRRAKGRHQIAISGSKRA